MGIAELIVAVCLQAEPAACMVHHRQSAAINGGAVVEDINDLAVPPGWYVARWTCRWRR
ncbi:hypothetical protein ACIKTA_13955 [Hansschlegelia beijingensis]